ncbi:MAG: DUF945 family protein [Thermodesulfobacteriota bacterium]|nr:DUF945 family protein [Thermodesulfobacteriota bacterium]
MKKILSILMALTIVILFALTWYYSRKTEQLFTAQIIAINQAAPELIKVELKNYQRKLFAAQAETAIRIGGEKEVQFNHQIRHFVWGVQMVTTLAPDSALANEIATIIPLEKLQLTTDFSLSGTSKSRLILPQFELKIDSGRLKITGFSAGWDLNADLSSGNFVSFLDNLQLQQADQGELNLVNLKISTQMADLQGIPLGEGELQLEKLQLMSRGESDIEFQNIQYRGQADLNQDVFSSVTELSFSQLLLAGESLSDGRLNLSLTGIDAELLRSLQQTKEQLQRQVFDQQVSSIELQLQLFALYTELLSSGMILNLEDFSLQTANGAVKGTGKLALLEKTATKGSLFSLQNVEGSFHLEIDQGAFVAGYRLFNKLQSGEGQYQNPAILVEQAEQIAGGLVQKGIFVQQDGDRFRIDFSWAEGQGKLNGKLLE